MSFKINTEETYKSAFSQSLTVTEKAQYTFSPMFAKQRQVAHQQQRLLVKYKSCNHMENLPLKTVTYLIFGNFLG